VYAKYVQPPADALVAEVLGQQWQWRYRFPGADGKLGRSDARFFGSANPFGLDPTDPAGQDDLLIDGNELHLPLGRPVKLLLRSHDVLHDFYAPQFRARMNMVPGMVTWFWLTPTAAGRYEVLCAQLCGVGHSDMRGYVRVEDDAAFQAWLGAQPSFARSLAPAGDAAAQSPAEQGRALAQAKGCVGCHSVDGSAAVGPSWRGLYGRTETLADGTTARVDEAFLDIEIRDPKARIVRGYAPLMPAVELSDAERGALVAYIRSLADAGAPVR
jgi:cytochrome c oxidase subunit 2